MFPEFADPRSPPRRPSVSGPTLAVSPLTGPPTNLDDPWDHGERLPPRPLHLKLVVLLT